jgi:primosomal protein N' (replication factor Y) (superfamily II helicase)
VSIIRVALDVPIPELFDYRLENARASIGRRVSVPFGRKRITGVVCESAETSAIAPDKLKAARLIDDAVAPLSPAWFALMRFCASYYQHPLGAAVMAALPGKLKTETHWPAVLWTPHQWAGEPETFKKSERTRAALADALQVPTRGTTLTHLSPKALEILSGWAAEGRIAPVTTTPVATHGPAHVAAAGAAAASAPSNQPTLNPEQRAALASTSPILNPEQNAALDTIAQASLSPVLLHGVTGSGKTEVYLHATHAALSAGRQVLVLVPEINLTPRLTAVFAARFPNALTVTLHSGLNETERVHHWLLAHQGQADIILGTRLGVLASLPRLGLIVVDEEHDPSFKQQEGMRYSARDLAVFRAHQERVPIVLGSATPSLETYAHGQAGRYRVAALNARAVPDAVLPRVRLIDLNRVPVHEGLSEPVEQALRERLTRGEQSLVFLNRRGFAPVLTCNACGWVSDCPRCTAYLVLHRGRGLLSGGHLQCHHCGYEAPVPEACPTCGNIDLKAYGQGTQRLEARLAGALPQARVLRIDRDATRRKGMGEALLSQAHAGEADILVGTQMLAKGHDFKNMTLVVALNVDAALFSSDFRASERLFAQLMQVSGRAGRAEKPGEVLIQTRRPEHPLFAALQGHDYHRFAQSLLTERKQALLPPWGYQALLRAEAKTLDTALAWLTAAADWARAGEVGASITIYDAVPLTLTRLNNIERAQLMVESQSRPALQRFLSAWVAHLRDSAARGVKWHVEVDPLDI